MDYPIDTSKWIWYGKAAHFITQHMALDLKKLEAHASDLKRQLVEIESLRSKYVALKEEFQAVLLLIERERERVDASGPEHSSLDEIVDESEQEASIPATVEQFFLNGAGASWYSAKMVTDRIAEKLPSHEYESVRANVGMALKRLVDQGFLERRNESETRVSRYVYRRKT